MPPTMVRAPAPASGAFGYDCGICAENIAGGYGTLGEPDPTFERWMDSADHKDKSSTTRSGGSAWEPTRATTRASEGYTMYTVDFGDRR